MKTLYDYFSLKRLFKKNYNPDKEKNATVRTYLFFFIVLIVAVLYSKMTEYKARAIEREAIHYAKTQLKEDGVRASDFVVVGLYEGALRRISSEEEIIITDAEIIVKFIDDIQNVEEEQLKVLPEVLPQFELKLNSILKDSILVQYSAEMLDLMKTYVPGDEQRLRDGLDAVRDELLYYADSKRPDLVPVYDIEYTHQGGSKDTLSVAFLGEKKYKLYEAPSLKAELKSFLPDDIVLPNVD